MSKDETRDGDRLEVFERKFVFRTARGYFLLLACCAVVTFVGGLLMGARGIVRIMPSEPAEPVLPEAPPAPEPLTLADVEAWITQQETAPKAVESAQEPDWVSAARRSTPEERKDPTKERFVELLDQFKALFPEPHYAWKDTYIKTCARQSPYGCLRYDRALDKEGVSNILEDAIRWELKGDSLHDVNRILSTMIAILESAPVERRGELIAPTAESYRDLQGGYRQRVRDHEREIAELKADHEMQILDYEVELAELKQERESDMMSGLYGVLFGLGLLVLVSVFLAHFAIERHLRLVREALAARS